MVSHLFYYQLAVLAILWLFVMLHVTWSKPGLTAPAMPAKPSANAHRPHTVCGPHAQASLCVV